MRFFVVKYPHKAENESPLRVHVVLLQRAVGWCETEGGGFRITFRELCAEHITFRLYQRHNGLSPLQDDTLIDVRKALAREGRVKQSGNTANLMSSLYPLKDAGTFSFTCKTKRSYFNAHYRNFSP